MDDSYTISIISLFLSKSHWSVEIPVLRPGAEGLLPQVGSARLKREGLSLSKGHFETSLGHCVDMYMQVACRLGYYIVLNQRTGWLASRSSASGKLGLQLYCPCQASIWVIDLSSRGLS
eukprot:COSAG02_NODE_7417_length_3024_cov_7.548511_4_plen_119_part_00